MSTRKVSVQRIDLCDTIEIDGDDYTVVSVSLTKEHYFIVGSHPRLGRKQIIRHQTEKVTLVRDS